jgi:NAD+ kinase
LRIALVPHPKKKMAMAVATDLFHYMEGLSRGGADIAPVLESRMKGKIEADPSLFEPLDGIQADVVIAIGGDGTILRTLQSVEIPVLGVNVGSLGFLMEVAPEDARGAVDRLMRGEYAVKERSKLHTRVGDEDMPDAANEVVLLSKTPAKMVSYEMYINMNWVEKVRGDGLIVSTPVGSTCYALSAGGSVLDPELNAFEIVPLAPFLTNFRPIIIPDTSVITIKIADRRRAVVLAVDGAHLRSVRSNEEILIKRSKRVSRFVRFDLDFYKQLHGILGSPHYSKIKGK